MALPPKLQVSTSIKEPEGTITVDYGEPYLWSVKAVKNVNKWSTDLWQACLPTYYSVMKNQAITEIINNAKTKAITQTGTANKPTKEALETIIQALATGTGKNYFTAIEAACKKPLFLHPAIDYATTGQIQAVAPGKILQVINANKTPAGFAGKAVYIEHELICTSEKQTRKEKFYAAYYHLDNLAQGVKANANVAAGSPIARTTYIWPNIEGGNRHLHLEIHSQPGLFDRWKPDDAIYLNMFSYIEAQHGQFNTGEITSTTFSSSEFTTKGSKYLLENPPKSLQELQGHGIKKSAEGKITVGKVKINSDMFLQTLVMLTDYDISNVANILNQIPNYAKFTDKNNYSEDNEIPKMPKGYVNPKEIFSAEFLEKLAPSKK